MFREGITGSPAELPRSANETGISHFRELDESCAGQGDVTRESELGFSERNQTRYIASLMAAFWWNMQFSPLFEVAGV